MVTGNGRVDCWFERLENEITQIADGPNRRLFELQHALVELIREPDPHGLRYSDEVLKNA